MLSLRKSLLLFGVTSTVKTPDNGGSLFPVSTEKFDEHFQSVRLALLSKQAIVRTELKTFDYCYSLGSQPGQSV